MVAVGAKRGNWRDGWWTREEETKQSHPRDNTILGFVQGGSRM